MVHIISTGQPEQKVAPYKNRSSNIIVVADPLFRSASIADLIRGAHYQHGAIEKDDRPLRKGVFPGKPRRYYSAASRQIFSASW